MDGNGQPAVFLLTDVEGSTRLWDESPAAMGQALERHDHLIHATVLEHDGTVVRTKGEGDSAFAVFPDPSQALACAIGLQLAFHREPWPGGLTLRVRMAIHAGEATPRAGDYYGGDVNRAGRLRSAAHGGQLIVSDGVRRLVGEPLPASASLRDLGTHRLRDLSRPERIWQVVHPNLPDAFPALRTLDLGRHNLPVALTTFVGREDECSSVVKRITEARLVTLVGPGGIGKSRLALQAAAAAFDGFGDGVWFVALDPLRDVELLAHRVAEALHLREEPGKPVTQTLRDHLLGRELLLLFDTCEHMVDGVAAMVADLLATCDGLRVMATSRVPLGVYGETIMDVGSLTMPQDGMPLEELAATDGVRLFMDRTNLVDVRTRLDSETAADVTSICRRTEGIPLAIELAASLVRKEGIDGVAARLKDRLGTLTDGPRTAPERQRTMAATIAWSVDLLDDRQRALFSALAVFAGGFTAEMATSVHDGSARSVGEGLDALRTRSLLQRVGAESRFELADTIREFAASMSSSDEWFRLASRHARSVSSLAASASGQSAHPAYDRLDADLDNIRAALRFSIDTGDLSTATSIAGSMARFWLVRAHLTEGRRWFDELCEVLPPGHPGRELTFHRAGSFAYAQGDHATSMERFQVAEQQARGSGNESVAAAALTGRAAIEVQRGHPQEGLEMATRALDTLRDLGPDDARNQALTIVAVAASATGRPDLARESFVETLELARSQGALDSVARTLLNLGALAIEQGDVADGRARLEEAVEVAREIGDLQATAAALLNLSMIAMDAGDLERAEACIEESLAARDELGDRRGRAMCLLNLAEIRRLQGRSSDAWLVALDALAAAREVDIPKTIIDTLETLASIRVAEKAWDDALRLLAAAEDARRAWGVERAASSRVEFERCMAALVEALGEGPVAARLAEPEDMDVIVSSVLAEM